MKEPISDDILSAYVDGELSAQERAEVERWLETSPAAREKLEDFRRLSGLFASLPRTEVPQEFPTKVLQLAERRMLLPETLGVSTLARSAATRGIRRWAFAVGAPIAAALLVTVYLTFRDPGVPRIELAGKDQAGPSAPAGVNGSADAMERGESAREGALLAQSADKETSKRNAEPELASGDSAAATAAPAAAVSPGGGVAGAPPRAMAVMRSAGKSDSTNLAAPALGASLADAVRAHPELAEINRALQDLGDRDKDQDLVSVVKLYVADSAEGMVLLQNVFADNDVLTEREGQRGGSDRDGQARGLDRTARKAGTASRPDAAAVREALYVVAEPSQLIAAFTEILSREDPAIRLAVEEPIEIAAFDARLQEQLKRVAPEMSDVQPRRREISAKASVAADKAPAPAPLPADGKPAADKAGSQNLAKSEAKSGLKAGSRGSASQLSEKKTAALSPQESTTKPQTLATRKEMADSDNGVVAKKGAAANRDANPSTAGQAATGESATGRSAPGQTATGQPATGQSRQLIVPMPEAIRQRTKFGGTRQRTTRDAPIAEKAKAPLAVKDGSANDGRGDEKGKSMAKEEQAQRAPTLVRVLILIEREVPRPAAPAASPPGGKGPSGGAS